MSKKKKAKRTAMEIHNCNFSMPVSVELGEAVEILARAALENAKAIGTIADTMRSAGDSVNNTALYIDQGGIEESQ